LDFIFLTSDQLAKKLQISRTTVFGWLKKGELKEGVHYLRLGRILRFRWPFFLNAQPLAQTAVEVECETPPESLPTQGKHSRRHRGKKPAVNLDY